MNFAGFLLLILILASVGAMFAGTTGAIVGAAIGLAGVVAIAVILVWRSK